MSKFARLDSDRFNIYNWIFAFSKYFRYSKNGMKNLNFHRQHLIIELLMCLFNISTSSLHCIQGNSYKVNQLSSDDC